MTVCDKELALRCYTDLYDIHGEYPYSSRQAELVLQSQACKRQRTFKSTGLKAIEKNRAAALSLCEQWQRVEDDLSPKAGSENHLKFENPREVAEQFVTATRKLAQGGFTEADARALLDELLKAGRLNPLSQESVEQFFSAWLEGKELAKKKRTADRYRKVVSDFLACTGASAHGSQ